MIQDSPRLSFLVRQSGVVCATCHSAPHDCPLLTGDLSAPSQLRLSAPSPRPASSCSRVLSHFGDGSVRRPAAANCVPERAGGRGPTAADVSGTRADGAAPPLMTGADVSASPGRVRTAAAAAAAALSSAVRVDCNHWPERRPRAGDALSLFTARRHAPTRFCDPVCGARQPPSSVPSPPLEPTVGRLSAAAPAAAAASSSGAGPCGRWRCWAGPQPVRAPPANRSWLGRTSDALRWPRGVQAGQSR